MNKFVAHPSCQSKMDKLWKGDFQLELHSWCCILLYTICGIVVYPFLALVYMVYPHCEKLKFIRAPCVKFWARFYFYVFRLVLIFSFSRTAKSFQLVDIPTATANFANLTHLVVDSKTGFFKLRRDFDVWQYYLVFILVLGTLWWELAQCYRVGIWKYISSPLNVLDVAKVVLYILAFVLHVVKVAKVKAAIGFFLEDGTDSKMILLETNNSTAKDYAYWITPDRFYWVHDDVEIISEGFFAIGNILDFGRFVEVFIVIRWIGTLILPFKDIAKDLLRFFIAFLIGFVAFMVGETNLYWYYDKNVRATVEKIPHDTPAASENLTDILSSLAFLFWSLFGMGYRQGTQFQNYKPMIFTQRLGAYIYAAFMIIVVLALLNILIAMFVDSYASHQRDGKVKWMFARTQLYNDYITPAFKLRALNCDLPWPLNSVECVARTFWAKLQKDKYIIPGTQGGSNSQLSYQEVMLKIRERYIRDVNWSASSRK